MSRVFFGKISKKFPEQFEEDFYAGGSRNSSWYGGLEIGDFVFPIFNSSVKKLWKVIEFDETKRVRDQHGIIKFEVVKEYDGLSGISTGFLRNRNFELDLNLLNKSVKSTAKEKVGFYPLKLSDATINPNNIDLSETRSIYIALKDTSEEITYRDRDIRILIKEDEKYTIEGIQIFKSGSFEKYQVLEKLYHQKNPIGKRYGVRELLAFSLRDSATNKEKFLRAVVAGLKSSGVYQVMSPVKLYDNLLVGRKKTKGKKGTNTSPIQGANIDQEFSNEDYSEYSEYVDLLNFSSNLILYGPPGTGKTYSVEKIIEAFESERTGTDNYYQDIYDEGRIRFITFHQSFSYEEFVEGLRPVVSSDESQSEGEGLKYEVQPGILRQIANKAYASQLKEDFIETQQLSENSTIWKISLGSRGKEEAIYEDCLSSDTIAIGWLGDKNLKGWDKERIYKTLKKESDGSWSDNPINDADSTNKFINEIQIGDIVLVFASVTSIRAIGIVEGEYFYKKSDNDNYPHRRKVKWLQKYEEPVDILSYNGGTRLTMKTVYELSRFKFSDIKEMLETDSDEPKKVETSALPYFLVIDEINRGNISKIFGELITLVEKDKRDKLKLQLPYSQKPFSLPSNLYIIGTMNTADRSIAILDTALRRRFVFKEMEPDVNVIRKENEFIGSDLNIANLFEKINQRITGKLDRDHRIGHSYFLNVNDLKQFWIVWYYQIIPLLMEYFYNDPDSIAEIISEAFIDKKTSQVKFLNPNEAFKNALMNI